MRTVSSAALAAAGQRARIVSSRLVVKDHRLRFTNLNKISHDSSLYDGAMKSYDADVKGSTIYRVANVNNVLYYMYLSNPGGSWPNWTNSGRGLKAGSRPGIYQNRVFYQNTSGNIMRADFSGSNLGGATQFKSGSGRGIFSIAPVGLSEIVVREATSTTVTWAKISIMTPTEYTWHGRLYSNTDHNAEVFDAEKDTNGWTYVFWSDNQTKRIKWLRFLEYDEMWSSVEYLIPMDVVDDLNQFQMGGVTRLGDTTQQANFPLTGNLWVGGGLVRSDGGHMQMYTMGPPWTMGRDIFVGTDGTEQRTSGGKTVPIAGGKIHFVGSNVFYIGPGIAYKAPGTDLSGDTSPTFNIDDVHNVSVSSSQNNSDKFQAQIPYSLTDDTLRAGSDIEWYASFAVEGGSPQEVKMGTYNIDAIFGDRHERGKNKAIVARSKSAKAIQMWKSDTSFDYWGADTKINDPSELTELVRLDGHYSTDTGYLVADDMNAEGNTFKEEKLGILYSTARPSRGGMAQAKFKFGSGFSPIIGILHNYYIETKDEAAKRMGYADPSRVPYWDWGRSYFACLWGSHENSGSPGTSIIKVTDGQGWDYDIIPQLSVFSLSLSANTWYWIMARMQEGLIHLYYRPDASSTWTRMNGIAYQEDDEPWARTEELGRMGLFLYNEVPWVASMPFNSNATVIPIYSKIDQNGSPLSKPAVYIQDDEQFYITDILGSANIRFEELKRQECHLWPGDGQPKPNSGFTPPPNSYAIWGDGGGGIYPSYNQYNDMCVVITAGPGAGQVFEVAANGWDYYAPQQWIPTGGVDNPSEDNWMDFVGDAGHGQWDSSYKYCRIFVTEDPRGSVRKGSEWKIVYKGTGTRGYNDTLITSHVGGNKFNKYTASRISVDEFNAWTNDKEWSMEDMIAEIARKAGVINIDAKKHINKSLVRTSSTWATDSQMSSYGIRMANCVVHMKIQTNTGQAGVQFDVSPSWTGGYVCYIDKGASSTNAVLMYADSQSIIQKIPILSFNGVMINADGWFTFSVQKQRVCVYQSGNLVAAFKLPSEIDTQSWAGPAYKGCTVEYDWPELAMRVDNFIMDIGQKASTNLNRLIGQKRIYWQDNQDGELRLYRERTIVNTGDPYDLAVEGEIAYNESETATRVRVEGAEAWMAIDEDALADKGNIFALANVEDVENTQDAAVEAEWLIGEIRRRSNEINLAGACDPRVEAGDTIIVTLPEGNVNVNVDAMSIAMIITETEAVFDMRIQGHDADA